MRLVSTPYKPKPVWLALGLCDEEGQLQRGFALELNAISLHCLDERDMVWDLVHTDGEHERIKLKAVEGPVDLTLYFRLGRLPEYITDVRMTGEFPAVMPISKAEFRARCGVGKLLNGAGHYVDVREPA